MNYMVFLKTKRKQVKACGFEIADGDINPMLWPWQRDIVRWAIKRGRAAMFEDCGLGKTPQQLEWARIVSEKYGQPVIVLTPLAVAQQTIREAEKFGIDARVAHDASEVGPGINITNYEKLHHFDPEPFCGIVLDESSILKSYDGKTRRLLQDFAGDIPMRLACTATPAPNDLIELCNHSEFLDVMSGKEVIALFFRQDGNTTHKWRLKGHARDDFWRWVAQWAVAVRKPSDLGHDDGDYILPALHNHSVIVDSKPPEGSLFVVEAATLLERRQARRDSMQKRVEMAAAIANGYIKKGKPFLCWCDLNAESAALKAAIDGAVEVKGSDSNQHKEDALLGFSAGDVKCLVTKPSIAGWGMNWQHCAAMAFVGLSDSYEQYYQAVRRCWRFGQQDEVNAYVVTSEAEGSVVANIERKEKQASQMFDELVKNMSVYQEVTGHVRQEMDYTPGKPMALPSFGRTA